MMAILHRRFYIANNFKKEEMTVLHAFKLCSSKEWPTFGQKATVCPEL